MMKMTSGRGDSWDPTWEDLFRTHEWGKYPPEYLVRFVARQWYRAPDRRSVRLLDLGCGPGAATWYMAREGFSVSGIDGSPTAIERARQRLESEGLKADLQLGDFSRLPWPDNYFDGAVDIVSMACNSFAFFQKVLAEVLRVLKPGGWLLSASSTDRSWGYGVGQGMGPGEFIDIREGPLQGRGFVLFMGRAQVDQLFQSFQEMQVELSSRTCEQMKQLMELWVVQARKPGSV